MDFTSLFKQTVGNDLHPYPYQVALAHRDWPDIVDIPTGLGKTAAIITTWIYKRLQQDPQTPRRLVYCLPMRVLVEQTAAHAEQWVNALTEQHIYTEASRPLVHLLMGGDVDQNWDAMPERDQILIGTQDQLLSRALNRGYSMSRFRWPVHFGLLNNDCLWVMDEIQLMGEGLATTAQLQAFREHFQSAFPVRSVWMSATLRPSWLSTIDFSPRVDSLVSQSLSESDLTHSAVTKRLEASKPLEKAPCSSNEPKKLAQFALECHKAGTRTLVVLNTVKRAQALFQHLKKHKPKCDLVLIHSRFRAQDKAHAIEKLLSPVNEQGTICVTTQVIEAGVDVSSSTLITDLAPWASLIQRFGRCNRDGHENDAKIYWLGLDITKKGHSAPYKADELLKATHILESLLNAKPSTLPAPNNDPQYLHVLRKKDLVDLFDTTPDIAGADIDVSRFIRDVDDYSLQVFWRYLDGKEPSALEPAPAKQELCNVPITSLQSAPDLKKWRWDYLEKEWQRIWRNEELYPGLTILLDTAAGGYSAELGWTGNKNDVPAPLPTREKPFEAHDDDTITSMGWQTLSDHVQAVVNELDLLLDCLPLDDYESIEALKLAARWHDSGKAHPVFQEAMVKNTTPPEQNKLWGKTFLGNVTYSRRGFRHELASALAMIENGLPDLAVYLAAAHHGKLRLTIRSLPNETKPDQMEKRFAKGIWDGDVLPEAELGNGTVMSETTLDLSVMELGEGAKGPSWLSRTLKLRDSQRLGPFKLAYLEALLRIADWRASRNQDSSHA
ncbi:type I-G CRISPR-associated helicase/endonuclease Cas3g [Desulfohalobium retbaense]|uniref:CRISPR-associated helicase Cas3 n=1 Tax=Desulfohalobium retbaense (strain ATCC 49708 / DSM 5692 / JCM 16813 / HR100) TaxID=485915 RepID=C8X3A9_DESRD|nr:CRISPR-associated helicase Cas3' [Desulfohalobium retbaense]ACV68906.1 CRISPR-associated helicase Cas3 [Desulfohalobium retbaense DSM 5692]